MLKTKKFWLIVLGLSLASCMPLRAELSPEILRRLDPKLKPEYWNRSPVAGYLVLQSSLLPNTIFLGGPNSVLTTWITHLFPPRHNQEWIANQRPSHPLSQIRSASIARLLDFALFEHIPYQNEKVREQWQQTLSIDLSILQNMEDFENYLIEERNNLWRRSRNLIKNRECRSETCLTKKRNEIKESFELVEQKNKRLHKIIQEFGFLAKHDVPIKFKKIKAFIGIFLESMHSYPFESQQALLAFFVQRASSIEELQEFLRFFPALLKSEAKEDLSFLSTPTEDFDIPENISDALTFGKNKINTRPLDIYLGLGRSADAEVKHRVPLISYKTGIVDDLEFPDCVETAIRNFFQIVLYDSNSKRFFTNFLPIKADFKLKHFFEQFSIPYLQSQNEARYWWDDLVMSNRGDQISYKKASTQSHFELKAGMKNGMSVLEILIFGEIKSNQSLNDRWDGITQALSRPDFLLEWKNGNTGVSHFDPSSSEGIVSFYINGKRSYDWFFQKNHYIFTNHWEEKSNWKDEIPIQFIQEGFLKIDSYGLAHETHWELILPLLIRKQTFHTVLQTLPKGADFDSIRFQILLGLSLHDHESCLIALEWIIQGQDIQWLDLFPVLLQNVLLSEDPIVDRIVKALARSKLDTSKKVSLLHSLMLRIEAKTLFKKLIKLKSFDLMEEMVLLKGQRWLKSDTQMHKELLSQILKNESWEMFFKFFSEWSWVEIHIFLNRYNDTSLAHFFVKNAPTWSIKRFCELWPNFPWDQLDTMDMSPIHWSLHYKRSDVFFRLISQERKPKLDNKLLELAIDLKNIDVLKWILKLPFDSKFTIEGGKKSIFQRAVQEDNEAIFAQLLEYFEPSLDQITSKNGLHESALQIAVRTSNQGIQKILRTYIQNKIQRTDEFTRKPRSDLKVALDQSVMMMDPEPIDLLGNGQWNQLMARSDFIFDSSPLHILAQEGVPLGNLHSQVDSRLWEKPNRFGDSPIDLLIKHGHNLAVRELHLSASKIVSSQGPMRLSPLSQAMLTCPGLLDDWLPILTQTQLNMKQTPFGCSILLNALLLGAPCDSIYKLTQALDSSGMEKKVPGLEYNFLHLTSIQGRSELISSVAHQLPKSLFSECTKLFGDTPLHTAYRLGKSEVSKVLLPLCPEEVFFQANHLGQTPMNLALEQKPSDLRRFLKQCPASYLQEESNFSSFKLPLILNFQSRLRKSKLKIIQMARARSLRLNPGVPAFLR